MFQRYKQPLNQPKNDAYSVNNNSPKNTTLKKEEDKDRMSTTPATFITSNNNKLANLIKADYDGNKIQLQQQ